MSALDELELVALRQLERLVRQAIGVGPWELGDDVTPILTALDCIASQRAVALETLPTEWVTCRHCNRRFVTLKQHRKPCPECGT